MHVYVRRLTDREIVYAIEVSPHVLERDYERFYRGLMRKTDHSRFYVDDSEVMFDYTAPDATAGEGQG